MLERVRKLLARAEHPSTPPAEAEAMSEKAAELIARYSIDRALLEQASAKRTAPGRREVDVEPPYSLPKALLLSHVADAYDVKTAIGPSYDGVPRRCTLIGFASDLAVVELLFTS